MSCYRNVDVNGFNENVYASSLLLMLASSSPRGFVKWREAIAIKSDEFPLNWKDNMNRKYCSGMPAGLCK